LHLPVLFQETLDGLAPKSGESYIDGTVGAGGHSSGILERSSPDGRLLGLDQDPMALAIAGERLAPFGQRAVLVHSNFDHILEVAQAQRFLAAAGVLLDLGVSSMQLDTPERGN